MALLDCAALAPPRLPPCPCLFPPVPDLSYPHIYPTAPWHRAGTLRFVIDVNWRPAFLLFPPPAAYKFTVTRLQLPPCPAQGAHTTVVIDVNWRPVFWDDEAAAKAAVLEYIQQAHILKVTDEVSIGI